MNEEIKSQIKNEIDSNDVCLFMKGTPDAPQCGFSMAVSNILKLLNIKFKGVNVLEDEKLREGIKVYDRGNEIPNCSVGNETGGLWIRT